VGLGMLGAVRHYIPAQQDVQSALAKAGEAAKQDARRTLGQAGESAKQDARRVLGQAEEAAKQYAPRLSGYLPQSGALHDTSLPSTETSGALPGEKTNGVGSLPGSNDETEVAKLPEKCALGGTLDSNVPATKYASPHPHHNTSASLSSTQVQPSDTPPTSREASPPTNREASPPGGVGDLPGNQSEVGVAVLPDERNADKSYNQRKAANGHAESQQASSKPADSTVGPTSSSTLGAGPTSDKPKSAPKHDGYGEGYHPAAVNPMVSQANGSTRGHEPAQAQAADSEKSSSNEMGTGTGSRFTEGRGSEGLPAGGDDHDDHGHGSRMGKPKFMDRVIGEAKVFVGKMGGNEEKIEEGRRMMGKSYLAEATQAK